MTSTTTKRMTAAEFFAWCDLPENAGRVFELDCGEVIEMSRPRPLHGVVFGLVSRALTYYLDSGKPGEYVADAALRITDDTIRGPDAMLFDRELTGEELAARAAEVVPVLCVEILSPSNRQDEMADKIDQYLGRGVKLVWVLDPDARTVRVIRPDELEKTLDETDTLTGNGVLPDFSCPVIDLFRRPRAAN